MKKWKKAVMFLLTGVILCSLAGCGEKKQPTESTIGSLKETTASEVGKEEDTKILIAAAASLEYVMQEQLIPMFEKENPHIKVEGTYDSSGKLQIQIEEGLEADVFFSAATKQMNVLEAEAYIKKESRKDLLENKLVFIVPADSELAVKEFQDIEKGSSIAIGDPESVPVGQYAKEALISLGIFDKIQDRMSLGTNVTEVLNWVAEGSADVGIVYATDAATTDKVKVVAEAPEGSLLEKVIYPASVLNKSAHGEEAQKFLDFLASEEAAAVFKSYGFTPIK